MGPAGPEELGTAGWVGPEKTEGYIILHCLQSKHRRVPFSYPSSSFSLPDNNHMLIIFLSCILDKVVKGWIFLTSTPYLALFNSCNPGSRAQHLRGPLLQRIINHALGVSFKFHCTLYFHN